ncbi:MAG TPA: DUF3592 domain-containing protein [Streptosporangiaceae bacterium]|nr:DUF3592 domain-containing protein [Streptosporangiaceae bacterium]
MTIVVGVWFALAGSLAVLAGLAGRRRARRLCRDGLSTWAMAVPPAADGDQSTGSPRRTLIQYTLRDGRVLERNAPAPVRKAASLRPGQNVLVWYDPDDPQDLLVYGREGRFSDRTLMAAGILFMLVGAAIAVFVH